MWVSVVVSVVVLVAAGGVCVRVSVVVVVACAVCERARGDKRRVMRRCTLEAIQTFRGRELRGVRRCALFVVFFRRASDQIG